MQTSTESSAKGQPESGAAILDDLENSLAVICRKPTASPEDAAFLAALARDLGVGMAYSGSESNLCRRLADVYVPFWQLLRPIKEQVPGTMATLQPFPSPAAIWDWRARATNSVPHRRTQPYAAPIDILIAAAHATAIDAVEALIMAILSPAFTMGTSPAERIAPARIAGPVTRALARDRSACGRERTHTYVIGVPDAPTLNGDREATLVDDTGHQASLHVSGRGTKDYYPPFPGFYLPEVLRGGGNESVIEAILSMALDAVTAGRSDTLGLDHVTVFQLPPLMAMTFAVARTDAGLHAALIDECDIVVLAEAAAPYEPWERARGALYPPHTLAQRAAAAMASRPVTPAWNPFVMGTLPAEAAHLAAVYRGAHDCAAGVPDPSDTGGLYEAARHLGIDLDSEAYVGRPRALCGDVRAAIASEYARLAPVQMSAPFAYK